MNKNYINSFLEYRAAPDILPLMPRQHDWCKEISESMAIISRIKGECLDHPYTYNIVDIGAGNALTSVIAAFTLPVIWCYAVDKVKRKGNYEKVRKFTYYENNFKNNLEILAQEKIILIASHACKQLAIDIINIYKDTPCIKGMVLIPCCVGTHPKDTFLIEEIGRYKEWCYYLKNLCGGSLHFDKGILSPCNGIITIWRKD